MTLIKTQTYIISIHMLDSFKATLDRVPKGQYQYYDWTTENGSKFSNRKEDIELWVNKNYISLAK